MQEENVVRDLLVSNGDHSVKATYFVERGMLYANVDGRILILPIGTDSSEETLRRLMIGQLHIRTWRERLLDRWHHR